LKTAVLSRRHLLTAGVAAGCASFLGASTPSENPLPEAIRSLKSMRGDVQPITMDEFRARFSHAQRLMAQSGLDAILITGGSSLRYFTGIRWGTGERLSAAILPAKGQPFFVVPSFEEDRLREQLRSSPFEINKVEIRIWHEDESPYQLTAVGLKDHGIAAGTLGINEAVPFMFSSSIAEAAPALRIRSATPVTAGCRMTKSRAELALMQIANQATWMVYRAVHSSMTPEMTQHQVSDLIDAAYTRVGFQGEASVQNGKYTALPHGSAEPQVIGEASVVMIDDGCVVEGYCSDITRTFVLGRATDRQKKVFEIVARAQKAALAAAHSGVTCGSIDGVARKIIDAAGFGPDYKYFSHRLGHGIGLDGHEWPYLVRGNSQMLAKGMTFSDEPGIYIPGEFGVRLEDDFFITENGAESFTSFSPSIEHPFG
jgi:Xaa-Pro dipeptidase